MEVVFLFGKEEEEEVCFKLEHAWGQQYLQRNGKRYEIKDKLTMLWQYLIVSQ